MTDVRWAVDDQVMTIVLDGPDSMNSLTPTVLDGLSDALDDADADHSLRAIVVTGAGEKAFCVGMDIDYLGQCFADPHGKFMPFLRQYHAILRRFERIGVPVVAKVNGLARAGGFELILACDFVIAADEAKVGDIHVQFGMPPGGGSSARAPRKLGDQKARALLLTSRWLTGPELVGWGLALESAPRADLDATVERFLVLCRNRSRPAVAITKRLVDATHTMTLDEQLRLERDLFAQLHEEIGEVAEGYQAFVDKRRPNWGDIDVKPFH